MPVLYLTIFISLLLVLVFIICFTMETWRERGKGLHQACLLPLEEDESEPGEEERHHPSPTEHS